MQSYINDTYSNVAGMGAFIWYIKATRNAMTSETIASTINLKTPSFGHLHNEYNTRGDTQNICMSAERYHDCIMH